jgi:hypothetical protein
LLFCIPLYILFHHSISQLYNKAHMNIKNISQFSLSRHHYIYNHYCMHIHVPDNIGSFSVLKGKG